MVLRIGTQCSMNLGQAVAVCLYELTPTSPASRPDKRQGAAAGDLDRYATLLAEILPQSGYVHSTGADAKIRRLVRRLDLSAHDAEVWLGMFRQIQWKLSRDRE